MTTGYDSPWKQGKRLDVMICMIFGKLFNSGGMRSGCSARKKITSLAIHLAMAMSGIECHTEQQRLIMI